MNRIIKVAFVLSFLLICSQSFAAFDTLSNVIRPRIGLGTGTFTYFGEIQNYQKKFSPIVNKYGGMVYVNAPISRFFNLEFSANYGKFAANERTLARNFNFESRVRMGTVYLYYNFYPLFQNQRALFHPYIGVGFSSFEFLSKTDLFDANGNTYYYWNDGSIMNMDQNDPLAINAVPLTRDYFYETDVREQDNDTLGKYKEQSFAFPLSVGFEWHLSPRIDFRLAMTYHFTLTDLIDGISPAGIGPWQGDRNEDRLLYSYVSLSYDLQFKRNESDLFEEDSDVPLYAEWDLSDWDYDGIIDALDDCAGTPLEAKVDDKGCPLDDDQDGVPNFNDDELLTPFGNYVDEFGVTITKEQFDRHWELFNDSTGYSHDFAEQRTTVEFFKSDRVTTTNPYKVPSGKSYVIVVGKDQKDVPANDLYKYLGYSNYKTIVRGDTVYYVLGDYATIEEAVAAKTKLDSLGVTVELVGKDNVNNGTLTPIDTATINKVEKVNAITGTYSTDFSVPHQVFRVQLGAFKNKIDVATQFPGVDVISATGPDGITRYYSGNFTTFELADAYKKQMHAKGIKNAFVVGYEDQQQKTMVEMGVDSTKLGPDYDPHKELNTFVEPRDTVTSVASGTKIDMSKVHYRVYLAYAPKGGKLSLETLNSLQNIGGVKPVIALNGSTTYYSREFKTQTEMESAMSDYKTFGLTNLSGVVEYLGVYYDLEEFNKLLTE